MNQEISFTKHDLSWFERHNPGSHVSGWTAIVKERGSEAENLFDQFLTQFAGLGLTNVAIGIQGIKLSGYFSQAREHLIIHKQVGFDNRKVKAIVTVDMKGNERGDLLCSWFLFERDAATAYKWFAWTLVVFFAGLFFLFPLLSTINLQYFLAFGIPTFLYVVLWVVLMVYLFGRGLGLWGRLYKTSPANPYERFDSAVLARYIDLTMKNVLAEAGVSDNEIEDVRFADASWIEERREQRPSK